MNCKDCNRFDSANRKCMDQKVNPQSWGQAVDVANIFGVRSICIFNDHRERLVRSRMRAADGVVNCPSSAESLILSKKANHD